MTDPEPRSDANGDGAGSAPGTPAGPATAPSPAQRTAADPAPGTAADPAPGTAAGLEPGTDTPSRPAEPRPWLERIGLATIALVMGALLTVMAIASWTGGEWILAAMSASGAILTVGVAALTLVRG